MHDALTISASHCRIRLFRQAKEQIFGAKNHKCRKYGIAIYIEALLKDKANDRQHLKCMNMQNKK